MADVALAAGRLVGDDRERVRLGAGAGRRRDGDDGPAGGQVRAVVLQVPDGQVVRGAQVERLGRVHRRAAADRHDDRAATARSRAARRAPRSTVEAPGFGSTSAKTAVSTPAAASTPSTRSMTPDPRDARVGHDEHARAAGRGDHLGESLDRADPELDPVAQDDLDPAVGQARHRTISTTVSVEVSRRTVSQRRQP